MAGLKTTEKLAKVLMRKHGLIQEGWTFDWDHAKTSYGQCHGSDLKITLSKYLTKVCDKEVVLDTILHEIAHALDNEERGYSNHDSNWKKWCRKVGATPKRLGPELLDAKRLKLKQLHFNYVSERRYRMRK